MLSIYGYSVEHIDLSPVSKVSESYFSRGRRYTAIAASGIRNLAGHVGTSIAGRFNAVYFARSSLQQLHRCERLWEY